MKENEKNKQLGELKEGDDGASSQKKETSSNEESKKLVEQKKEDSNDSFLFSQKINRDDEKIKKGFQQSGGIVLVLLFFSFCLGSMTSTSWRGNRKGIDAVALVSSKVSKTEKAGNVALKKETSSRLQKKKHSGQGWEISIGLRSGLRFENEEFAFITNRIDRQLELRSYPRATPFDNEGGPLQQEALELLKRRLAREESQKVESMKQIGMPKPYVCLYFDVNRTFQIGKHKK